MWVAAVVGWFVNVVRGETPPYRAQRRLTVGAVTLLLLLWRARADTPRWMLVGLAAAFLVAATVWLHAQYVDDLDNTQWVLASSKSRNCIVVGLVFAASGLFLHVPGALPFGVIVIYYGLAFRMAAARDSTNTLSWEKQTRWLVGAVVAGLVGLLLLGYDHKWLTLGALALLGVSVLAVAAPRAVLLGECVIRALKEQPTSVPARAFCFGGAAAAVAIPAAVYCFSPALAVAAGLVSVFVAAMVSGTHADFVAIMLVAALLGTTAPTVAPPDHMQLTVGDSRAELGSSVLVALGDSYMSGEGATVFYDNTYSADNTPSEKPDKTGRVVDPVEISEPDDQNQCRQSPTSWVAQEGQLGPFDSMLFLACQGALTQHLLRTTLPFDVDGKPTIAPVAQGGTILTQLDAAVRELGTDPSDPDDTRPARFRPKLVVVSVGGNDAGFSGIGRMCLGPGDCSERHELWDARGNFDELRRQLDVTYRHIAAVFPDTPVAVIPYPDPVHAAPDGSVDCGGLLLTQKEALFVRRFVLGDAGVEPAGQSEDAKAGREPHLGLDQVIQQVAEAHGFHYVEPMVEALAAEHLQLCDKENKDGPGLHFVTFRSIQGVAEERFNPKNWLHSSLHPNERGHAALLRAFDHWYREQAALSAPDGEAAPAPPLGGSTDCSITDHEHGCRHDANTWSAGQLKWTALHYGLVLALAAAAGGACSAGLTAWRRRKWSGQPVPCP